MAIYGIGAKYDRDVSGNFIANNIIGTGWSASDAPDLHEYIKSLKVGDIVFIKRCGPRSTSIQVEAIGIIKDSLIINSTSCGGIVEIGRNVKWIHKYQFSIPIPPNKNNFRANTLYEEFHPEIQKDILAKI